MVKRVDELYRSDSCFYEGHKDPALDAGQA